MENTRGFVGVRPCQDGEPSHHQSLQVVTVTEGSVLWFLYRSGRELGHYTFQNREMRKCQPEALVTSQPLDLRQHGLGHTRTNSAVHLDSSPAAGVLQVSPGLGPFSMFEVDISLPFLESFSHSTWGRMGPVVPKYIPTMSCTEDDRKKDRCFETAIRT